MTNLFLGIDPGIEGAWAVVDANGGLIASAALPTTGEGTKRMVSAQLLATIIRNWPLKGAFIERVGAMPGQGVSSMFRFGRACGVIEGAVAACGIPIGYVSPQVWKRHYGLPAEKEPSRRRAIELWPNEAGIHFSLKKDHGRAEAALIALWGSRYAELAGAA